MREVEFIIMRNGSFEECTFAMFRARVALYLKTEKDIKDALKKAITSWILQTEDGRDAYEKSGKDLNIGDLVHYRDKTLDGILVRHGIQDMQIDIISSIDDSGEWMYDDHLFNEEEIEI